MSYARATPLTVGTGCPARPVRHLVATKTQLVAVSGAYSRASGEGASRQWRTGGRAWPSCGPPARDPDPADPLSHGGSKHPRERIYAEETRFKRERERERLEAEASRMRSREESSESTFD